MVEEVKKKETLSELITDDQIPSGESEETSVSEVDITEPEIPVVQEDEGPARANARLIELEEAIASRDAEITSLKQTRDELEARVTALGNSLAEAVAGYRDAVIQANPEIIGKLVSGETIEAINESLNQAKALVSKVRQGLEAEISLARVPAGAPERTSPDLSSLSPREKIQYAIGSSSLNR